MERLDKAFARVDWVNMYPLYSLRNLPIVRSDHGPIILDLELQTPFKKRPFKFEHMSITHSTVIKVWFNKLGICNPLGLKLHD